jgi:hypothetical protein
MQRVSRSSAVPSLPAAPASPGAPGYFTGGNPGLGQAATTPGYEWFNAVQEELMAVILRGGLTASPTDLAQVRKSLDRLFGGSLSSYATNATLSVNEAGLVNVDASGGARVITLPPVNALGGRPIRFQIVKADGTANTVTVQVAAGDAIIGLSSIVLSAFGDSVTLVSDGGITWVPIQGFGASPTRRGLTRYATAAEVDAGTLSDVAVTPAGLGIATRSFSANGYQRFPGGLIIQWGETTTGDIAGVVGRSATFPIAFPNACRFVSGSVFSLGTAGATVDAYVTDMRATATGVIAYLEERTGSIVQNCGCRYLVIGN